MTTRCERWGSRYATPRRSRVQESWSGLRTESSTAAARNAALTANSSVDTRPSIGDANMFNNGNLMTLASPSEAEPALHELRRAKRATDQTVVERA